MMAWTCDLHSHTKWSDGSMSARQMAQSAVDKGLSVFGISEHSPMRVPDTWSMKREDAEGRKVEMAALQKEFAGRLTLLCGLELDYMTRDFPLDGYDYIIGSVHQMPCLKPEETVDESEAATLRLVREHFGGDHYAYTAAYYRTLADFAQREEASIIGHFDIIAKFNEGGKYFDEEAPAYLRAAKEAIDALCERDKIFEINTGAIARGYRSTAYPSRTLLRFICERGGRITFGSDAHDGGFIAYRFDEALALAKACGFASAVEGRAGGFAEKGL